MRDLEAKYEQALRERAELEAAQKRAEELQQRLAQEVGLEQEQRRRLVRYVAFRSSAHRERLGVTAVHLSQLI